MAQNEAPDLADTHGIGKVGWVLNATLRFAAAAAVTVAFLFGIILLSARFQADTALAGGGAQSLAQLADAGGGVGISDVGDETKMAAAREAADAYQAWQVKAQQEVRLVERVNAQGQRLVTLAQRAGCPTVTTVDAARACAYATEDDTLRADINQTTNFYQQESEALLATRAEIAPLIGAYENAAVQEGASLQAVLPALRARDSVVSVLPATLQPAANWFFALPLLVSSVVVAFLGGMFGAVAVLLILLAFPTYAPLTFGGGQYFFLRMLTGGFVALLVFMVIQSGVTVAGMAEFQSLAGESGIGDPTKIALLGVFAGAFSEQIAGAVKGYVDRTLGGGDSSTTSDPAITPPAPPEGGPRPAM